MRQGKLPLHLMKGKFVKKTKKQSNTKSDNYLPRLKKNFDDDIATDQVSIDEVRRLPSSAKKSTRQDLNLSDNLIDPEELKYLERAWYNYPYYQGGEYYEDMAEYSDNPAYYYYNYPTYDYGEFEEFEYWMLPKRTNMHEVNRYKVDGDKFEYEIYGDDAVAGKELQSGKFRDRSWIDWQRRMYPGYEEKYSAKSRISLSHRVSANSLDSTRNKEETASIRMPSRLLDLSTRESNIINAEDVRKQKSDILEQISRQRQYLKDMMKRIIHESRNHFHRSHYPLPMMRNYDMITFY